MIDSGCYQVVFLDGRKLFFYIISAPEIRVVCKGISQLPNYMYMFFIPVFRQSLCSLIVIKSGTVNAVYGYAVGQPVSGKVIGMSVCKCRYAAQSSQQDCDGSYDRQCFFHT